MSCVGDDRRRGQRLAPMQIPPHAYVNVSDVARRLGARPRDISDLFYKRALRDDLCPVSGGRRMIPIDYIEVIRAALKRAGRPLAEVPISA